MISQSKAQEATTLTEKVGVEQAALTMGLRVESVKRYLRMNKEKPKKANVLVLDIETAPMEVFAWSMWKVYVQQSQVISDWFIISWAAKWLYEPEMLSDIITPEEAVLKDDKRILGSVWNLLEEADFVIGHNCKKFDIPRINTRLLYHRQGPPSPYQMIDTLDTLKRAFAASSNKQGYVNSFLKLKEKMDTGGFELWAKCLMGDQESLNHMLEYNKEDVYGLEELYTELRPWIRSHPNLALFGELKDGVCTRCDAKELDYCGTYSTMVNTFKSFRCRNCGSIMRSRHTEVIGNKKANLLIPTAR